MATPLPDLSEYNVNVTPYQGLSDISRVFGKGAGFGDADYIAARQAGYTDPQIVSFLKANPYLDAGNVSGAILAGQQDAIIAGGLPNLNASDPNRAALANPNPTSYTDPYIQKGVQGRGNDPSVQMANANVNVAGNDTYNQLMQASQAGTLVMAKAPDSRNPITGQSQPSNTYRLIDSATGNVVADSVSPTQTNGVYQFGFSNPQSEGSVNAYIRADPTTGAVGAIDPSKQLSYQAGAGGGMLSGIAQMALPVLAGLALPGIGSALGSALGLGAEGLSTAGLLTSAGVDAGTAADIASGLSTASKANQIYNTANALQNGNISGAAAGLAGLSGMGGGTSSTNTSAPALSNDQVGALSNLPSSEDIGTSYDLTPPSATPVSNADQAASMGSMANIGTPYQGQGAISGANALDPTTAYLNTFDLTNPSAEASTGTTTSYGGGLGQSFYNVPTTPVSQQQPGVPTTSTSVPVSSGYALTPDLTGPGIAPSNATLNGNPVASATPAATGSNAAQNYFNSVINEAAQNTPSDKTGRTLLQPTMFTGQAPSQQQNILSPLAQLQLALSGYQPALTKAVRQRMAHGGQPYHPEAKPGEHIFRTGGHTHYVQGKGDGQSDDIPAMLADGEYVFDADTVSQLGDGSNKAGAEKLDKFREALRRHKRSAPDDKIPPKSKKLTSYLKEAERG